MIDQLTDMTEEDLKQAAFAQYEYAMACLRASANEFYDLVEDKQTYFDAPDYFEEIIESVGKIRKISMEIKGRRTNGLSHHDAETV